MYNFSWTLFHDIVPTKKYLQCIIPLEQSTCCLCKSSLETLHHLLITCHYPKATGFATQWSINLCHLSIKDFIKCCYLPHTTIATSPPPGHWPTICASLSKYIWKERCSVIFTNSKPRHPMDLATLAQSVIQAMPSLFPPTVPKQNPPPSSWKPPPSTHLKLNVVIAFTINENIGIGYVLRNYSAYFIAIGSSSSCVISVEEGEAKGVP